ncbi:hypothetical protein ACS0TY_018543 [Phlomoides rotata]
MANNSNVFQDDYFYGLIWPKPVTEGLITFLLTQKATGNWIWNSNNGHAIMAAREYLNSMFHTDYSTVEVLGRVKKMRSHFHLFDHMISISGVEWDRKINYLFAPQHQWRLWHEELFAPDDDDGDDNIIIMIDSDNDDYPLIDEPVVHSLPAVVYNPLDEDILVINSDDDDDFN